MIQPKEISQFAFKNKVQNQQIEKDYILSWVLYGISQNAFLKQILVFKGGTVLKKAYIEDYRFSEDLDFTLLDESVSNQKIREEFNTLLLFVAKEANIPLQIDDKKWTEHESGSPQFYIDYVGPLQGAMGSRDLKIDITRGEILETEVENRNIFRTYSDLEQKFKLPCYSLAEILIEKMAALMGRTEPRDLYDFWYLTEIERLKIKDYTILFNNKAKRKNQNPNNFAQKVLGKEVVFKKDWIKKLDSQIHNLPKYEDVCREAKRHFKF